jgi:hypothetical protein
MQSEGIPALIDKAMQAARQRSQELGHVLDQA